MIVEMLVIFGRPWQKLDGELSEPCVDNPDAVLYRAPLYAVHMQYASSAVSSVCLRTNTLGSQDALFSR